MLSCGQLIRLYMHMYPVWKVLLKELYKQEQDYLSSNVSAAITVLRSRQ